MISLDRLEIPNLGFSRIFVIARIGYKNRCELASYGPDSCKAASLLEWVPSHSPPRPLTFQYVIRSGAFHFALGCACCEVAALAVPPFSVAGEVESICKVFKELAVCQEGLPTWSHH